MVNEARAYYRQTANIPADVGNFIRQWRELPRPAYPKGWSQGKLASESGVSLSSISAYERGENDPSIKFLGMISKALGVPRGVLLDVDPTKDPELWDAWLRASPSERQSLNKVAAGLVGPLSARKRRA
jgi:ribosome-binding protein aMBF1 (putative translation factor)